MPWSYSILIGAIPVNTCKTHFIAKMDLISLKNRFRTLKNNRSPVIGYSLVQTLFVKVKAFLVRFIRLYIDNSQTYSQVTSRHFDIFVYSGYRGERSLQVILSHYKSTLSEMKHLFPFPSLDEYFICFLA